MLKHCLGFLLLASILCTQVAAQNNGLNSLEEEVAATLAFELEFDRTPLEQALFELTFSDSGFLIVGNRDKRISGVVRANTQEDAFKQLEDIANLLVVRRGDRFIVYSSGAEAELREEVITYVYRARKARASDLLAVIENQDQAGYPTANALATNDQHMSLEHHKTKDTGGENFGGNVTADLKMGLQRPLGDFVEYQLVPNLNGVLLRGPIGEVRKAVDFLKVIDHPIPIVLIEVMIVQYNHTDGFTWRYNFFDGSMLRAEAPGFATTAFGAPPLGSTNYGGTSNIAPDWGAHVSELAMSAQFGTIGGGLSSIGSLTSQFKQNLTLLMDEDLARIVTNPHISVINGQSGSIVLDEKFNFQNTVQTQNQSTLQKADSLDAVTSLLVTPTVISPNLIHIAVNAELGVFTDIAGGLASSNTGELPGQRTNEIGTSVVLGEDETLIIGGLVKEQVVENRNKIPGLSRIPLFGHLFRDKRTSRIYTETVIYVTPRLAQPQGYEEQYRQQVFNHARNLMDVGEMVREQNRMDEYTSNMLYKQNEDIDHEQWKKSVRDRICKPNCNCPKCRGYQVHQAAYSSGVNSPATQPTSLPPPPVSSRSHSTAITAGYIQQSQRSPRHLQNAIPKRAYPRQQGVPVQQQGVPNASARISDQIPEVREESNREFWNHVRKPN